MMHAPVIVVPCSSKAAYLKRYAQPDKGWTDEDEARWPVPFWHIDTGMAALLILQTVTDEGLGACYFGIPPERVGRRPRGVRHPRDVRPHRRHHHRPPDDVRRRRRLAHAHVLARPRRTSSTAVAGAPDTRRNGPVHRPHADRSTRRTGAAVSDPRHTGGDVAAPASSVPSTNPRLGADEGVPHDPPQPVARRRDPRPVSLVDYVLARADELADKPALIDGPSGRTLTYGALDAGRPRARRRAASPAASSPATTLAIMAPEHPRVRRGLPRRRVRRRRGHHDQPDVHRARGPPPARRRRRRAAGDRGAVPRDRASAAAEGTAVEEIFVIGEADGAASAHRAVRRAARRAGARRPRRDASRCPTRRAPPGVTRA